MITDSKLCVTIISDSLKGISDKELRTTYKITQKELDSYKAIVLNQLPAIFIKQEPVSYAIRHYQELIKNREFTIVLKRDSGFSVSQCSQLYEIITQKVRPTYGMIYMLRDKMPPINWYYKENEALPEAINFTPIHNNYTTKTWADYAKKKTCAHFFFDMIKEAGVYTYFCEDYGLTKTHVGNYVYMKNRNGEKRFCVRPAFPFVNTIKEELHPDYWYMFPDEVPNFKETIKQLASDSIARHTR